ncbi:hypothetical protein LKO27_08895 [Tessaracoccus sp. OS52]|uniref:aldose epimerase family protein n=1 Tax=Tessaracoccus sp. OS52 TaxID=2886691 RepID=UPI001D0F75AE|nr:hypothetical protein [Tessaracoccus sp. OS52]MCC2593524.1 hypothetical protein [Tessaracoccus sp. OS52]
MSTLRSISNVNCSAAALDLGATVTSWRPADGEEVLFVSSGSAPVPGLEFHGGIPVCAPWFGRGRDGVHVPRPHGLVRWVPWELVSRTDGRAGTRLVWELDGAAVAHLPGAGDYPSDIRFRHEVTFGAELVVRLTVGSPSTGFVLDEALHTYFAVEDVRNVRITELEDAPFRDHSVDPPLRRVAAGESVVPAGSIDRVYQWSGPVRIEEPSRTITVTSCDAASVVVWNPGPAPLPGFGPDEWTRMVCVEVGNVQGDAVKVPAGGSHTLSMTVSVARPDSPRA